jgi:hypothetical protein
MTADDSEPHAPPEPTPGGESAPPADPSSAVGGPPATAPATPPAGPPAGPPAVPGWTPPQPPPQPVAAGGIYSATPTDPGATWAGQPPIQPTPGRSGGRGRTIGLGVVALAVVVVLVRVALGLFAATVVGNALGTFFGGPYSHLPADQRQLLEQRFDTAVGTSLDGLSDADASTAVGNMIADGMPRLDDATLVDRLRLFTAIMSQSDVATCGSIARSASSGAIDETAASNAVASLDADSFGRWVEINVSAIEAHARNDPPQRTADVSAVNGIFDQILPQLPAADTATLVAMSNGSDVTDTAACDAWRHLYSTLFTLSSDDLPTIALYDVSP